MKKIGRTILLLLISMLLISITSITLCAEDSDTDADGSNNSSTEIINEEDNSNSLNDKINDQNKQELDRNFNANIDDIKDTNDSIEIDSDEMEGDHEYGDDGQLKSQENIDDTEDINSPNEESLDDYSNNIEDTDQTVLKDEKVDEHIGGYIFSEFDNNAPAYDSGILFYSNIPSFYPGNGVDALRTIYPEAGNQGSYGTCWAFASIGLAEFDLINKGLSDKSINLSELQLAYNVFNSVVDPLNGTMGDNAKYYNDIGSSNYLNYGGTFAWSIKRLSQWTNAVSESYVPYSLAYSSLISGVSDEYAYNYDEVHLENAYLINKDTNNEDVKAMIMEHGAVGASYYHTNNNLEYNNKINAYTYYDNDASAGYGHAIMIVGWDDGFSKDNFTQSDKPTSNGAWLIRNSWGSYCDYFWMSYETVSLSNTVYVFDFNISDNYDNNYQLDGGLETSTASLNTMANVFTVEEKIM